MTRHVPVLMEATLESLQLKPGMNVVDCTLGDGGHSEAMLLKIAPEGKLLGIDADAESILRAKQYLYRFGDKVICVRDNFSNLEKILADNKWEKANAILIDLGWSSPQFEERGRGFSFSKNEPLDMRYCGFLCTGGDTAADILNSYSFLELSKIFKNYGEEKFAKEIAEAVVSQRKIKPLATTNDLVEVILQVYRIKLHSVKEVPWIGGLHPATKVFQALRIVVNDELGALKKVLPQAVGSLASGGRLAVITFHSLEDRIVKQFFQIQANKTVKLINKKPIGADAGELKANTRARSAKLRVVEKI